MRFGLERRPEFARVDVIIFDGVAGPQHGARSRPGIVGQQRPLHVLGQRGRDAVGVDGGVVEAFGLQEDLVAVAVAEAHHLVLDRRAVARARGSGCRPNTSARGAGWRGSDRAPARGRARDAALDLRRRRCARSGPRRAPARRRPACLSTPAQSIVRPSRRGGVPVFRRPSAKPNRSRVHDSPSDGLSPDAAGRDLRLADVDQAAQERAGGEDDGARGEAAAVASTSAAARPSSTAMSSASPSTTVTFGVAAISACMALA